MELRHLRAFVAVAEELNFHRAAERLRVSQPPLSQQIRGLEREVGVALFRRTTRRVELTAAGAAFLAEARRALRVAEAAPQAARRAAEGLVGTIRLGFTGPSSYQALLTLARLFRDRRPDVRLDIVGAVYTGELLDLLDRDELDAAFIRLPTPRTASDLRVWEVARQGISVALPDGHRLAERASVGLDELADESIIGYPANRGAAIAGVIHAAFAARGISPSIRQEGPETHTIMLLVGAGAGIGLVPSASGNLQVPGVVLVPVPEIPPLGLALAWRTDSENPALGGLTGVLDELAAHIGAGQGDSFESAT